MKTKTSKIPPREILEIIADNLKKRGWSLAGSQRSKIMGAQFGQLMRIVTKAFRGAC